MKKSLLAYLLILISTIANAQNTWVQKTDIPVQRSFPVAFSIGAKGYVGTGYHSGFQNDLWEYDPSTNAWTQMANFPGPPRGFAVGFAIGSKGYVGTGTTNFRHISATHADYNDFYEYDQSTNSWTPKASLPGPPRGAATGFSIGTKGYIGTGGIYDSLGNNIDTSYNDFYEYNPTINTWAARADFPALGRWGASSFSIGTKGYIGVGYNYGHGNFRDFYEFNPATNSWTAKADFGGTARGIGTGFSIGSKGYIGLGDDTAHALPKSFYEYNPATDNWVRTSDYPGDTGCYQISFSIGSKGYVGLGAWFSNAPNTDLWEYTPDPSLGVVENNSNDETFIYPNPATSELLIKNDKLNFESIQIYNVIGESVMVNNSKELNQKSKEGIDISGLSNGVYFIEIKIHEKEHAANYPNGTIRKKLIKN